MNASRIALISQQKYIQKVVNARQPREKMSAGRLLIASGGFGADMIRLAAQLIAVGGLVAIAIGATTDCKLYQTVLDWISSRL